MRNFSLIILFLISFIFCGDEFYQKEGDVLVLNEETFGIAIREYKYILVLFHAQWCNACEKLLPEYQKIATTLKKENIIVAKIDAGIERKIADRYEIESYPSLLLFNRADSKVYKGEPEENDILIWTRQNATPNIKVFTTEKEIEEQKAKPDPSAIYFGNNPKEKAEFILADRAIMDINLGIVESEELIKKYTQKPGILVLFKNFDELRNDLDISKADSKEIEDFLRIYSKPRVSIFTTMNAPVIFARRNQALIFFAQKSTPKWDEFSKIALNVANKLLGKILVFISDIDDGMQIKLAELAGLKPEDLPTIRIIDAKFAFPRKYKMKNIKEEINEENVIKFYNEWSTGKIDSYLRSEPEPQENDGDVKVIVSDNFKKEIINNDKDIVIFFFAPWCGHCQKFYPKYEELAHKLRAKNPKLVFAKMDATENDIPDYPIRNFPTIKFYPGNKKDKNPISISNRKSIDELFDIIKENAVNKVVLDDEKDSKDNKGKHTDL